MSAYSGQTHSRSNSERGAAFFGRRGSARTPARRTMREHGESERAELSRTSCTRRCRATGTRGGEATPTEDNV